MSSKWELDDGIESIKSAWQREHTARANLEKMLENAEAEKAKLREERDMYRDLVDCMVHPDIPDQLAAENDRLRELLRAAYNCTNAGPSCLECRVVAGGCTLLSAMRELGIEVDG